MAGFSTENTKWVFRERILLQLYSQEDRHFLLNLMSVGKRVSHCPNFNLLRYNTHTHTPSHSHTHTLHHFTRHQTLTKSLFSAARWHSNSRLTKSHAGRILITASQSPSCMRQSYLHMRGAGVDPKHCLHTSPAYWDVFLCAYFSVHLPLKGTGKNLVCDLFIRMVFLLVFAIEILKERSSVTFIK